MVDSVTVPHSSSSGNVIMTRTGTAASFTVICGFTYMANLQYGVELKQIANIDHNWGYWNNNKLLAYKCNYCRVNWLKNVAA